MSTLIFLVLLSFFPFISSFFYSECDWVTRIILFIWCLFSCIVINVLMCIISEIEPSTMGALLFVGWVLIGLYVGYQIAN